MIKYTPESASGLSVSGLTGARDQNINKQNKNPNILCDQITTLRLCKKYHCEESVKSFVIESILKMIEKCTKRIM